MKENIQQLHERGVKVAKTYLGAEADLIEILMHMYADHGYREFDSANLKEYSMKHLGLSENPAETLCRIARKCRRVPGFLALIKSGEISITNAKIVCSVLTAENQEEWLTAASHLSKPKLEALIAEKNPEKAIKEMLKQVNAKIWEFRTGLTHAQKDNLRRVQDLESSRLSRVVTLAESLDAGLEAYLERNDPIRRARRAWMRKARRAQKIQRDAKPASHPPRGDFRRRKKLKAEAWHELTLQDDDQCTFVGKDGTRCESRRWLERHHRIPVAHGGPDTPDNLQTLCSQHHALIHHRKAQDAILPWPEGPGL